VALVLAAIGLLLPAAAVCAERGLRVNTTTAAGAAITSVPVSFAVKNTSTLNLNPPNACVVWPWRAVIGRGVGWGWS